MSRLLVHVEGQTEETFVNEVLAPHLYHVGYSRVAARLLGNVRQRSHRGGITGWPSARKDILNHLREDGGAIATTMVDYYALPSSGQGAWPGRAQAAGVPFGAKCSLVENSLLADITSAMGTGFDQRRFVPYIVMHEFEGLLFSDCVAFSNGIGHPGLAHLFQQIRNQFPSPEHINDSPITAPSKRILQAIPNYEKPLQGVLAAIDVGLGAIQSECPLFANWLNRLDAALH